MLWVPVHEGVPGNDRADEEARSAQEIGDDCEVK